MHGSMMPSKVYTTPTNHCHSSPDAPHQGATAIDVVAPRPHTTAIARDSSDKGEVRHRPRSVAWVQLYVDAGNVCAEVIHEPSDKGVQELPFLVAGLTQYSAKERPLA
jgi:hypothetical protein